MSLKDEFLKAKLISKKDVKRIEHEERVERKQLGEAGIQEKEQKRMETIEQKQREQKKKDQELAKEQQNRVLEKSQIAQLEEIINQGKITDSVSGSNRFFFIAKDGKIPFLWVSDNMSKSLERGNCAIVECGENVPNEFIIVDGRSAEKIRSIQPNMVRFYQR